MLTIFIIFFTVLSVHVVESLDRKENVLRDIKDKLKPNEASGGSSYAKGGCGTGLHIYIDPDDDNQGVESSDNSVSTKVSIHEYLHLLQQAFLNGDSTTTTGPVALDSRATNTTTRFHVIYGCDFPNKQRYGQMHVRALNNMTDAYKLLDVPTYVILYPADHSASDYGCSSLTDDQVTTRAEEIYDEIYGTSCTTIGDATMVNENHAFAEGAAEYYALNMTGVWTIFNGWNAWTQKVTDNNNACDIPSGTYANLLDIKSGSSAHCDEVVSAYANVGKNTCTDNPIGELVYKAFLDYCTAEGFSCTHQDLMNVWINSGVTHKKGWCTAFKTQYGKTWGEFVCYMENLYGINSNCVATDVPCMEYSDGSGSGDEDGGGMMTAIIVTIVIVISLFILALVVFHFYHPESSGNIVTPKKDSSGGGGRVYIDNSVKGGDTTVTTAAEP